MSDTKVPPEFEWIKPGVKVIHKFSKQEHIVRSSVYLDGSNWKFHIVVNGLSLPVNCEHVFQPNQSLIALTLTREQAELVAYAITYSASDILTEIKKQIEEKLK